jgi:hypothetical protein
VEDLENRGKSQEWWQLIEEEKDGSHLLQRKLVEASTCRQAWEIRRKVGIVSCHQSLLCLSLSPYTPNEAKLCHLLQRWNGLVGWIHLIWKKNGRCFG